MKLLMKGLSDALKTTNKKILQILSIHLRNLYDQACENIRASTSPTNNN